MTYRVDYGVFILRGQPFTEAHLYNIAFALSFCQHLFIVLGSAFAAPRWDHIPFREYTREAMILASLTTEQKKRITFIYQKDYANMTTWADKLTNKVINHIGGTDAKVALVGHAKDKPTGFYLQQFPDWESVNVPNFRDNLSATPIRDRYLTDEGWYSFQNWATGLLPVGTLAVLQDFRKTSEFNNLMAEKTFMVNYLKNFYDPEELAKAKADPTYRPYSAPYPPIFYCADAVVIQGNKVLLVTRGAYPGKGLLATPGGHCENDIPLDAAIRELIEETGIKVPEQVLRGSIVGSKEYNDPNRSTRKRTITTSQYIHLTPKVRPGDDPKKVMALPKVRGRSDAVEAKWRTISNLKRENMFEDSWKQIADAVAAIKA